LICKYVFVQMTFTSEGAQVAKNMTGLKFPLALAKAVTNLNEELERNGFNVEVSSDFQLFNEVKLVVRQKPLSPLFDPAINDFAEERAFWMRLTNDAGETVALQAYRNDAVATSLADWCLPYMIGLYVRRNELLVPTQTQPPVGSIARRLRGNLVYHGELWVDRQFRPRSLTDTFSKLGMLLALIKWQPDAVWALTSHAMATHGYSYRLGYSYMERGFLRWQWLSEGMDEVEYLCVAEREALEQYLGQGDAPQVTTGRTDNVKLRAVAAE
jgi:hypothetical protein